MNSRIWPDLPSTVIGGHLLLSKLVYSGRQSAIFEGRDKDHGDGPDVFIQLFRVSEGADIDRFFNRFGEARYMQSRHLVELLEVGFDDPESLVYCVAPKPAAVLTQVLAQGPMTVPAAVELTTQLLSALSYLHGENFVFCNLRPEAVWKTDDGWKLADFSQLRLTGRVDTKELRTAITRYGDVPPEPYQGVVSPAWDVWSLGLLLQRVFAGPPGRKPDEAGASRSRLAQDPLPPPFQQIVRECLDPDPDARPTLAVIRSYMQQPAAALSPELAAPPRTLRPERPILSMPGARFSGTPREGWFHVIRKPNLAWLAIFAAGLVGVLVWIAALLGKNEPTPRTQEISAVTWEADRTNPKSDSKADETLAPAPDLSLQVADKGVRSLLEQWVTAMRRRDVNRQVACYAPLTEIYYSQHRLSRRELAAEKERQFASIGAVRKFELANIQVNQVNPHAVVVLFDKTWDFASGGDSSGSARTQLTVRKLGPDWKIAKERELKLYWVKHEKSGGRKS